MPALRCQRVGPGMRDSERTVEVRDIQGRREFLRVPLGYLEVVGDTYYVPVGLVQEDAAQQLALIELPQEGGVRHLAAVGPPGGFASAQGEFGMILCDREIRAALARLAIRITPDPTHDP